MKPAPPRLVRWRTVTALALLVGYAGYYLCRSNLSVAIPALVADPEAGVDRFALGAVSSAGIVAYAAGKSITGVAGDFIGGRRLFLGGLFLSVVATLGFSVSAGVPAFMLWWIANRFVQSAGWAGLTKTAAHWFPSASYGTVMSVLSLSYLFGDAVGRVVLGRFLETGTSWQGLFVLSAATLAVIGVIVSFVLRDSPVALGLPEPPINASNLFGAAGSQSQPGTLRELLRPYVQSPSFALVCVVACGMTLIREAFNTWIPAYLVEAHGIEPGTAAEYSAVFPFVGGLSALAVGAFTDRYGNGNRLLVVVPAMGICAVSLGALAVATARGDLSVALIAIAMTALSLLGPYTLLAGAIAMDFGGRRGSATAAGLIDTAGYLGGTLSGMVVGGLADSQGWAATFNVLAALAAATTTVGGASFVAMRRRIAVPSELGSP